MPKDKVLRAKKCRCCGKNFYPHSTLAKACSVECAIQIGNKDRRTRFRREAREYKIANETLGELTKKAQKAVNDYIRIRDKHYPCISCGEYKQESKYGGNMDAGHWFGTGAHPNLRFRLWNIHKQCKKCNRELSGNPQNYRLGLIRRYGMEWVMEKEKHAHKAPPARLRHEYLRRIAKLFRKKARLYGKLRANNRF